MPAYCFLGCPWPIRSSSARSTIWRLPGALCSSRIRSAAWLPHVGPHCCSSHCQGTWQHDLPKGTHSTVVSCTASVGRWEMQLWGLSAHADHSQHREVITVSGEVSLHNYWCPKGWVRCQVWDTVQAESCHQCHCSAAEMSHDSCRSPTLCWAAGHASTVSPLHLDVMLAQDLQGTAPPSRPQGFQDGRMG